MFGVEMLTKLRANEIAAFNNALADDHDEAIAAVSLLDAALEGVHINDHLWLVIVHNRSARSTYSSARDRCGQLRHWAGLCFDSRFCFDSQRWAGFLGEADESLVKVSAFDAARRGLPNAANLNGPLNEAIDSLELLREIISDSARKCALMYSWLQRWNGAHAVAMTAAS